jgi:hypothetical protein
MHRLRSLKQLQALIYIYERCMAGIYLIYIYMQYIYIVHIGEFPLAFPIFPGPPRTRAWGGGGVGGWGGVGGQQHTTSYSPTHSLPNTLSNREYVHCTVLAYTRRNREYIVAYTRPKYTVKRV